MTPTAIAWGKSAAISIRLTRVRRREVELFVSVRLKIVYLGWVREKKDRPSKSDFDKMAAFLQSLTDA
jgi:hypothetical protein|tara:strand:- start:495 stop:698 length:204 start_codon:yes stop_codon:yes gene_type:complete